MSKIAKLIIDAMNNPKAVRFKDACKIAVLLGFVHKGGQGSHKTFGRVDESQLLNFENRKGYIAPYQARQLLDMVEK